MKYSVLYGNIITLQIFVEEQLKRPILLFVITQKSVATVAAPAYN